MKAKCVCDVLSLNTKNQRRKLMNMKLTVNNVQTHAYASIDTFFCSDFLQTHLATYHYFYDTNNKLLSQTVTCEHSYQLRKQFSAGVKITLLNKENLGIVGLLIKPLEFCFCLPSLNRILSFWPTKVNPKASGSQTFWFRIPLHSYEEPKEFSVYMGSLSSHTLYQKVKQEILKSTY